jgi:uncharacterized lipoprotein YajG
MKKVIFILLISFTLFGCESQQERTNVTNPEVTLEESKFIADTLMHGYYKTRYEGSVKYIYYYNNNNEFTGRDKIISDSLSEGDLIFRGFVLAMAVVFIAIMVAVYDN